MLSKNLTYFRLRKGLSKRELAERVSVTEQAVRNYELGIRYPRAPVLKRIAEELGVRVIDFTRNEGDALTFSHGKFRKQEKCNKMTQDLARAEVEDFCRRLSTAVGAVGGAVLPEAPKCHALTLSESREEDAEALREYLGFARSGPVPALVDALENKGIVVVVSDMPESFSGMSGMVNSRPYIMLNKKHTPENMRITSAHELAHLMFVWDGIKGKKCETSATAIAGAFLFPKEDAVREIGYQRKNVSMDLEIVCKEYGISMHTLAQRAYMCGLISKKTEKSAYMHFSSMGWNDGEPARIQAEKPRLLKQLVYRAVTMNELPASEAAELLRVEACDVEKECGLRRSPE